MFSSLDYFETDFESNQNFLFMRREGDGLVPEAQALLVPRQGVHGAAEMPVQIVPVGAVEAAQAGPHLLAPALHGLLRQAGVRDQGSGHADSVALAGGDQFFRQLRGEDGADGEDGDIQLVLLLILVLV